MRPDLQGLEITRGELRKLSGVEVGQVFRRSLMRDAEGRSQFFLRQIPEIFLSALVSLSGFIFSFSQGSHRLALSWSTNLVFLAATGSALLLAILIQCLRVRKSSTRALIGLLDEVDCYNAILRAIDINDQIEEAGNPAVALTDRRKVTAALKLARVDLVRALKTERILRENKHFIARNPDLFANNLTALTALQLSDRVSEQGRFLDEALQIAVSVQEEMRELQNRHLRGQL